MRYYDRYDSPLGEIWMGSDGECLCGLWLTGQRNFDIGRARTGQRMDLQIFRETRQWLELYFSGKAPDFTPKLSLSGTPFRLMVWKMLLEIPYGETTTYGRLAELAAKKCGRERMSAQAVGGAVGNNPISIIVPCHRVVGADGSLTGYAGGVDKKAWLLEWEKKNAFK